MAMLQFDVYLFDEQGVLLQLVPIQAASQEGAREKALYLEKSQHAATHVVMPTDTPDCEFSTPSEREIEAHHLLLRARDRLRRAIG
jgi:hypothetical protein